MNDESIITQDNVDKARKILRRSSWLYGALFFLCMGGLAFSAYQITPWLGAMIVLGYLLLFVRQRYIDTSVKRQVLGSAEMFLASKDTEQKPARPSEGGTYL